MLSAAFAALVLMSSSLLAAAPKRVALVFDDGPVPAQTPAFLALLAAERVHVTFSYVGKNVAAHPALARAAADAGHEIINHSYTHPHLKELDDASVRREAADTSAAIAAATGRGPRWFWAPFLECDERVAREVREAAGLEHFPYQRFHFLSTSDWDERTTPAAVFQAATTDIRDQTVVLCHEWPEKTLAQLPAIIAELKRQGCVFLTFSELAATLPPDHPAR